MNEAAMEQALDATHDEALKLNQFDLPEHAQEIVDLIISLARYRFDVRGEQEKQNEDTSQG